MKELDMDGETPLGMGATQRYAERAAFDLMVAQNDKVTIEKMKGEIAQLTAELAEIKRTLADPAAVWTNMLRGTIARPRALDHYEECKAELEKITAERDAAQKACAEMRYVLDFLNDTVLDEVKVGGSCQCNVENGDNPCGYCATVNSAARIEHALSTDCGKGYGRISEWQPVVNALRKIAERSRITSCGEWAREAVAHAEKLMGKEKE